MTSKYYYYNPPKGRSNTVLKVFRIFYSPPPPGEGGSKIYGTSKHYGDLEQFDLNALWMKNNVPESTKIKTLGLKPWLDTDQNKLTQYITNRFPSFKPKSGNYSYSYISLLKSQREK